MRSDPQPDGWSVTVRISTPADESYFCGQVVAADGTTYTVVREDYGECLTECYHLANLYGEAPRKGVRR